MREKVMLVLSRRVGEEIVIADNIRVRVLMVQGKTIRLGITAPKSIPVVRQELLTRGNQGASLPAGERDGKGQISGCESIEPVGSE